MPEPMQTDLPANSADSKQPPIRPISPREIIAWVLLVALADVTIYRGQGDAGVMAFVLLAPGLLLLGMKRLPRTLMAGLLVGMLLLIAMKLLWSGTGLAVFYGIALVLAFAMEAAGVMPYVLDMLAFTFHLLKAGFLRLEDYFEACKQAKWMIRRATLLQYGLPLLAVLGFGGIFVRANPDLADRTGRWLRWAMDSLAESLSRFTPSWSEGFFCLAMAWIFAGLLKPLMKKSVLDNFRSPPPAWEPPSESADPYLLRVVEFSIYPAYFNTLLTVIVLFAGYLVFEFQTLWMKDFPAGFYYSGYAHEGAAWLTIALALATALLSLMFRAEILLDHRLPRLRRLAWIWSALNLCLAAAVYHRLLIYVGFNGMTRMRTVGFLGISAVVAGFLLVVRKIANGQDFVWLIRRQLWVLAFAGFLFAVIPVDSLVCRYNARRILAGDPAPSVQISVHPLDSGGMMELLPLLESENPIIREGVRAMLAQKALDQTKPSARRELGHWSGFQWAGWLLAKRLEESPALWSVYEQAEPRHAALKKFQDYAYQWY